MTVLFTVINKLGGSTTSKSFHLCKLQFCCHCSLAQACLTLCDPRTTPCQVSLPFIISQSLHQLKPIELVMPSNHLLLCCPLLLLPSIFPSIRVFSNELVLRIWWPKYWSFSFSISPSNEYSFRFGFL